MATFYHPGIIGAPQAAPFDRGVIQAAQNLGDRLERRGQNAEQRRQFDLVQALRERQATTDEELRRAYLDLGKEQLKQPEKKFKLDLQRYQLERQDKVSDRNVTTSEEDWVRERELDQIQAGMAIVEDNIQRNLALKNQLEKRLETTNPLAVDKATIEEKVREINRDLSELNRQYERLIYQGSSYGPPVLDDEGGIAGFRYIPRRSFVAHATGTEPVNPLTGLSPSQSRYQGIDFETGEPLGGPSTPRNLPAGVPTGQYPSPAGPQPQALPLPAVPVGTRPPVASAPTPAAIPAWSPQPMRYIGIPGLNPQGFGPEAPSFLEGVGRAGRSVYDFIDRANRMDVGDPLMWQQQRNLPAPVR